MSKEVELEQENQTLRTMVDALTEAVQNLKDYQDDAESKIAELQDMVAHLSQRLWERDDLVKTQEAELKELRAQLRKSEDPMTPMITPARQEDKETD